MFLVSQISVKFEISNSSKFLTNLVIHFLKMREFSHFNQFL